MSDFERILQKLATGPGPASEQHTAYDDDNVVTMRSGPENIVSLNTMAGVDETARARLERSLTQALQRLLKQDSPFARTLINEIQPMMGLDEFQARMHAQAEEWQARSDALKARLHRVRGASE